MSSLLNISELGRLWATSGNLVSICRIQEPTRSGSEKVKKVTFQSLIRVILIPSKDEYVRADLFDALWWRELDYASFKLSAFGELKSLMLSRNIKSSKEAINLLYQPSVDKNATELIEPNKEMFAPQADDCPPAEILYSVFKLSCSINDR